MNCRKIFNCAAVLIAEDPYDENIEDLLMRSVGVINTFIYNTYDLNCQYVLRVLRKPEPDFTEIDLVDIDNIDDDFPLCDDLAGVCIYYLASVLSNNENPKLSDKLDREYNRLLNEIVRKIPGDVDKITDIYN